VLHTTGLPLRIRRKASTASSRSTGRRIRSTVAAWKRDSKDQAYACTNENSATGAYKYTINIVSTDGSPSPKPLDPTVAND